MSSHGPADPADAAAIAASLRTVGGAYDLVAACVEADAAALLDAREASTEPITCPECKAGKHANCDGQAWDTVADRPSFCECSAPHRDRPYRRFTLSQ